MRWLIISVALILIDSTTAHSVKPDFRQGFNEISIPYYDNQIAFLSRMVPANSADGSWSRFIERYGKLIGRVNTLTGNISRVWGGSIPVGIAADDNSAVYKSLAFLDGENDPFNIPTSQLRLISCRKRGHLWYVEFGQTYRCLDVFDGRISFRISDKGNIVLIKNSFYRDINISVIPSLSAEAAIQAAGSGLSDARRSTSPQLIVFPYPSERSFDYRLAYILDISAGVRERFRVVVDAHTGEVIYRKRMIYYSTVDGHISGRILQSSPFDTLVSRPFEFEDVTIEGAGEVVSGRDGYFLCQVGDNRSRPISTGLYGNFAEIYNNGEDGPSITDTIIPGDTLFIEWNDGQSRRDERNVYYHANFAHDFIKAIDPDFVGVDYPMPCYVNLDEHCNAFWDGYNINFFKEGDGCNNTGEISDVIYHEYGHAVTDYLYRPYSAPYDLHEGWSDYFAATITNQPLIGRGFNTGQPDSYIRTVDNNNRFPEDMNGEPHNDGLVIGGALWDLREALSPNTGYCDTLFQFAKYGKPVTFQDYLLEILLIDDDDDNLFNFTPNWNAIIGAFNLHGVVPSDIMRMYHTALDDTPDSQNPYPVSISVDFSLIPPNLDSMFLYYRTNFTGNFLQILMAQSENDHEYTANIPAQPALTAIEYYFSLSDMIGRHLISPALAPTQANIFFIGSLEFQSTDNLEISSGWTIGSQDDDATSGIWIRVDPIGTYSEYQPDVLYQPEDDHTPSPGVKCYITGQQPPQDPYNDTYDVDGGRTTLNSPILNLENLSNPIIEYYRWFTNSMNIESSFLVNLSSNGGATWMPVENLVFTENRWTKTRITVSNYTNQFSQLKLRFIAIDDGIESIVEAGIDDISIYDIPAVSINDNPHPVRPMVFKVYDNYPNPFNLNTVISFDLPEDSDIEFSVYDVGGSRVYSEYLPSLMAGNHSISWNMAPNKNIASGIYFYRIQTNAGNITKKMLLLK